MSVQFGRWNTDGKPMDPEYLESVKPLITPYGPDDGGAYTDADIAILYRAFHTTKESRQETQPYVMDSGSILTWDGRLDNRSDLLRQLVRHLTNSSSDVSIVAAAYEEWGTGCFAKLIGDWALSIWNPKPRSLLLARDPIGSRRLHYSMENGQLTWSTILDPMVLRAGRQFSLDENYIAGWLTSVPAANLTPYREIKSVPPSAWVLVRNGTIKIEPYWDFNPRKTIRYPSDSQYEEHFREVFAESVRRRLRSDTGVLAALSGGMDSSSIVCMADRLHAAEPRTSPRVKTLSYFDDSESSWNERPFFTAVERQRGEEGWHIPVTSAESLDRDFDPDCFAATPACTKTGAAAATHQNPPPSFQSVRVLLSGVGGDEVLGGIPAPTTELADHLRLGHPRAFLRALAAWSLDKRMPWVHLLLETIREFLPVRHCPIEAPSWLDDAFARKLKRLVPLFNQRLKILGPRPSFQQNRTVVEILRGQLHCARLPRQPLREVRYPYLDRDLLEFLFAIPRSQLLRPGQRRSLMRRALNGIVPKEILNRRRKAFVFAGLLKHAGSRSSALFGAEADSVTSQLRLVDAHRLLALCHDIEHGSEAPVAVLTRTLVLERWLRHIVRWDVLKELSLDPLRSVPSHPLVSGVS